MNILLSRTKMTGVFAALVVFAGTARPQESTWTNSDWQDSIWANRGCLTDQRGQWFRNAKFGAFIHFGLYSELGGYWHGQGPYDPAEQIMGLGQRKQVIPGEQYKKEVGGAFNPAKFDAHKWVSLIKKAGQKYLIVTAKHHDGFSMFRTATTPYNLADATPFARDVIKELADECKKQGIVFCPYYSIGDWAAADVMNPKFTNYTEYMHAQLRELLSNYGEIKMLWFDNWWYVNNQWRNDLQHAKELYAFVRSVSPNTLVNDRCGRGAASTDGDYTTPENQLQGSRQNRYFEVVMTDTDDDNWGWVKTATNYRRPADLIRNLIDCASKGGNFVLNVGPTADGEFPSQHLAIIDALGKWTSANGEAIYGTVPVPEFSAEETNQFQCYATMNSKSIFLHVTHWPSAAGEGIVRIARTGLTKLELLDASLGKAHYTSAIEKNSTLIRIKQPARTDPYATVFRLNFGN
ncbi:putative Alpha-L-fucosidase [Verrucomicrobia bacterium]|nr:putative Alpha-L-fucosidase [Verrucomicrobiota bacterium]